MPSKERNGDWYPVIYLSHALSDELMSYIEDADDNDEWEEVDNDDYLSFEEKRKSKISRKSKTGGKKNKNDDEEDEDGSPFLKKLQNVLSLFALGNFISRQEFAVAFGVAFGAFAFSLYY